MALGLGLIFMLRLATLAPEQSVREMFGTADGSTSWPEAVAPGSDVPGLPEAGQTDTVSQLVGSVTWLLPEGRTWNGVYLEEPLPSFFQNGRVVLAEGRWPTEPGEVVVSRAAPLTLNDRATSRPEGLSIAVVGVVDLPLGSSQQLVLGHPGAWSSWQLLPQEARTAGLSGQLFYYWLAPDPDATAAALDATLVTDNAIFGSDTAVAAQVRSEGLSAKRILEQDLPGLLITLLGAISTGALLIRFINRNLAPLSASGVPRRTLQGAAAAMTLVGTAAALVLGYVASLLILWCARALAGPRLDHELRPWEWTTWSAQMGLAAAVLLPPVMSILAIVPRRRRLARTPRQRRDVSSVRLMWVAGGAGMVAVISSMAPLPSFWVLLTIVSALSLVAGCLAILLVDVGLRGRPGVGPRLAGQRMLAARRGPLGSFAGVLAAVLTVTGSTLAIAGGVTAHLNSMSGTGYPPGLALFMPSDLATDDVANMQKDFEEYVGVPPDSGIPILYATLQSAEGPEPIWLFTRIEEVERVLGGLDERQRATIQAVPLSTTTDTQDVQPDEIHVPQDLRWLSGVGLRDVVDATGGYDAVLYPDLDTEQDLLAAGWAAERGYSSGLVQATSRASDLPIPWPTQIGAAGFGLIILLVVMLALRGEIGAYRGLIGTFNALGLSPRWLNRVGADLGWRVGSAAAAAALIGSVASLLLASRSLHGALSVTGAPWIAVLILCFSAALGAAWGGSIAARKVSARDRLS